MAKSPYVTPDTPADEINDRTLETERRIQDAEARLASRAKGGRLN